MTHSFNPDWDPRSETVLANQIAAYDDLRRRCPVARSDYHHWSILRHEDVTRALMDHETFSNVVSQRISVPNGMDPPEHTPFRAIIEPFFSPEAMAEFEPICRGIVEELVNRLPERGEIELIRLIAEDFAILVQCAFMGWPERVHEPLRRWTRHNSEATLSGDRERMATVAHEFDGGIRRLLQERRDAGEDAPDDATTRLMRAEVDGRPIEDAEIVSIIRNFTVGELATISASVGIVVEYLARRPELQDRLRAEPELLPAAIDEILRIHAPLIANRRVTTCPVEIGGRQIGADERITLIWASANRDEAVFDDPDEFRLDRDPSLNLLYGAGIHVCPGAPLARLELRLMIEAMLAGTSTFSLVEGNDPVRDVYPSSGFRVLPLQVERRSQQGKSEAKE